MESVNEKYTSSELITQPNHDGFLDRLNYQLTRWFSIHFKKPKQFSDGNPKYHGLPPGVGRTVSCGYRFKHTEDLIAYWKFEIGITSKNIHK